MENIILTYLNEEVINTNSITTLSVEEDLLGSGLVDSMSLMRLIAFLERTFETKIPAEDLLIENFESVKAIADYLQSKSVSAS